MPAPARRTRCRPPAVGHQEYEQASDQHGGKHRAIAQLTEPQPVHVAVYQSGPINSSAITTSAIAISVRLRRVSFGILAAGRIATSYAPCSM
ncbi:hypothetical protein I552_4347 [Mycobacterium xenopi 3993]|nr:hypothetical protein I552_4347 [Mycobacterium xenopi 3993]